MSFSTEYALMYGLAGFAAATYNIKNGDKSKHVPLVAVIACMVYTAASFELMYAFLTAIEFAIGLGIAHGVIDKPRKDE